MIECIQILIGAIGVSLILIAFGILMQLDEGKSLKEIINGK